MSDALLMNEKAASPVNNLRVCRPLIIGHYGGCNTGDEAMLMALLQAVGPDLRAHAAVVSKNGRTGCWPSGPVAETIPPGLSPVIRALLRSDGLVLGGGTHFHDDYITRRYLRHFRYMLRITVLSMLAKLTGKPVFWLGMGFGPFYRRPTRWVTRLGLKFCDRVSVRDTESQRAVSEWIAAEKLTLAFDLAAILAETSPNGGAPASDRGRACPTLGISVTSLRHSKTSGPRVEAVFWRRLAAALNRILDNRPEMQIKVIVLRGGNREADWDLSHELHGSIAGAHRERCKLVPYSPEPQEMLKAIASCDAFFATRYHAGLLAYLAGCNLLFFAYHRKVCDLAREIGLADSACITPDENLSDRALFEKLNHLIEGADSYRAKLPISEASRRAWLNIQTLGNIDCEI